MKKVLACCLVLCFGVTAMAGDVVQVGPGEPVDGIPLMTNEDVCGVLDFDGVNGLSAQRRTDGLESFVLSPCEGSLKDVVWYAIDNTDGDFLGVGDYATDSAANVEGGAFCGDHTADLPASREPLLDDSGNQVVLFGRNAWIYTMEVNSSADGYIGPRIAVGGGQSFILTRPCDGDGPVYFQSEFFGFACSVPGIDVFGADFCAATLGRGGDPVPNCVYVVNTVKTKKGPCGDRCGQCPWNEGDTVCAGQCEDGSDCKNSLKGFLACAGGGVCKVKAGLRGCEICPRGSIRCR